MMLILYRWLAGPTLQYKQRDRCNSIVRFTTTEYIQSSYFTYSTLISMLTIISWRYKISRWSNQSCTWRWPTLNLLLLCTIFYIEHIPKYLVGDIHHVSSCFFVFFICDLTPWIVTVSNADWIYIEMVNGLCVGWLCKNCWDRQCHIDPSRMTLS